MQAIIERCCGLDVHQETVVARLLVGSPLGRNRPRRCGRVSRGFVSAYSQNDVAGTRPVARWSFPQGQRKPRETSPSLEQSRAPIVSVQPPGQEGSSLGTFPQALTRTPGGRSV
jgi:hypothetical protein